MTRFKLSIDTHIKKRRKSYINSANLPQKNYHRQFTTNHESKNKTS